MIVCLMNLVDDLVVLFLQGLVEAVWNISVTVHKVHLCFSHFQHILVNNELIQESIPNRR